MNIDRNGTNRLIDEKSPYLLQHASNPVDWYPWGDEAFEKAKREDKPIFLSIGYSTCHWCHVMENESFEDKHVANLMNEVFISIKVDREERSDIDNIYMTVCQILTGGGGWPLTIIMTPDKIPFYAATYIPKENRYGLVGLLDLIPRISELWKNRRDDVLQSAKQITEALAQTSHTASDGELGEPILKSAFENFEQRYDRRFGGFGSAPKFPTPHNFLYLLRYWKRSGEQKALEMVERTLEAMRLGGICDQLGFGFHRYSTDPQWLAPHFEKMLYDQALMAMANIEAYQVTGREIFKATACEIFEYVMRDLTSPDGTFYSAEDADSEGIEGKFYLWQEEEIRSILSPEDADFAVKVFNLSPQGNFETHLSRQISNILHLIKPISELAQSLSLSVPEFEARLQRVRARLFRYRESRVHPHKDDKILTDWNGLMIAALALGGQVFDDVKYTTAASQCVDFIKANMRSPENRLYHRYRDGEAAIQASVDDYAFLIWGLLNLYEATFDIRYLRDAIELCNDQIKYYWDHNDGGFFFVADDAEKLPVRQKEIYDGAVPSGNSVSALNLIRLGKIMGKPEYKAMAENIFRLNSSQVRRAPQAFTMLLTALDFALGPSYEVVIIGRHDSSDTRGMLKALRASFTPNKIVILRQADRQEHEDVHFADFIPKFSSIDGKATAYVCRNYSCELPTTDITRMLELLDIKAACS